MTENRIAKEDLNFRKTITVFLWMTETTRSQEGDSFTILHDIKTRLPVFREVCRSHQNIIDTRTLSPVNISLPQVSILLAIMLQLIFFFRILVQLNLRLDELKRQVEKCLVIESAASYHPRQCQIPAEVCKVRFPLQATFFTYQFDFEGVVISHGPSLCFDLLQTRIAIVGSGIPVSFLSSERTQRSAYWLSRRYGPFFL